MLVCIVLESISQLLIAIIGQTVGDDGRVRSQLSGLRLRPGSKYSHPIYSCVTAIKASIRTVHFRARGHSVLSNLDIQSIGPSESTKPLWVVEKSGWDIAELDPLWGIAHPHLRESPSRVVEVVVYDWRYAALIFCFAAIYLGLFLWSVLLLALKKCSLATLHFMLDQTAAGRSITTERFNGDPAKDYAKTKQWAQQRGHELVYVSKPDILGTRRAKTEYRMVGQRDEKRGQRYSEL